MTSTTKDITPADGNVFADIGFDPDEAANLKIRANLMIALRDIIEKKKLRQHQAAELFGVNRPEVSNLVNGQIQKFSIDKLIMMLERSGKTVEVKVANLKENIIAGKKTSGFNSDGIESLAKDKPVVYKIENNNGVNIYTGVAQRGRVEARLKEHLPGGKDAIRGGAKVRILQKSTIAAALKAEARIIKQQKPAQNKKGK